MSDAPQIIEIEPREIDSILAGRPSREYGAFYKFSPASQSIGISNVDQSPAYVDRASMSATATISTATVDRVRDVLIPKGCDLSQYEQNPVVLWGHGLEGISVPIATSRDPSGKLAVNISDTEVKATSYFSQRNLEAAQIFQLIDEGIIRATSVRETPVEARKKYDKNFGDILVVTKWLLEEWSWCAIGVNPDSVAKAIDRNRLDGKPIAESVLKSLMAVSPVKETIVPGANFKTEVKQMMKKTESVNPVEGDPGCTLPGAGDDAKAKATADSSAKNVTEPGPQNGTVYENLGSDDDSEKPHGQKLVAATHSAMKSLNDKISKGRKQLENKQVHRWLDSVAKSLDQHCTAAEGLHAEEYPGATGLGSKKKDDDAAGDAEPDDDSDDGSEMKSFLADNSHFRLTVSGVAARLKSLALNPHLPASDRKWMIDSAEALRDLSTQAKSLRAMKQNVETPPANSEPPAPKIDETAVQELRKRLAS